MSRMHAIGSMALASIVGAATAIGVTMWLGEPNDGVADTRPATHSRPSVRAVQPVSETVRNDARRLVELERRIEALAGRMERAGAGTARVERLQSPPDLEELRESAEEVWERGLAWHAGDAVNGDWARNAQVVLQEDIAAAAATLSESIDVDCRTEICLAAVPFDSFQEATDSFASLLQHPYRLDCAVSVAAPEPDDPTRPYEVEMLFGCGEPTRG